MKGFDETSKDVLRIYEEFSLLFALKNYLFLPIKWSELSARFHAKLRV